MAEVVQLQDYRQASPQAQSGYELVSLDRRKKWFQDSQDLTERARKLCEQDRDYRDHKQWTAYELNTLRRRGQPPIVINHIARKVDNILGIAERSQSDPKGYPRTPRDEDAAEICTDSLRFICDQNRYQRIKSAMLENIIVEGTGGAEVIVEQRNGQMEITVNRLRWEEIFADPYSREPDFSDARFKGLAKWMNIEDVADMWGPEAAEIARNSLGSAAIVSGSFEDRPKSMVGMTDMRNKRVVVADMYCRHGDIWHRYIFCAGGDLVPGGPSPYNDEYGKPTCPIELQSLYVNRENERYGFVRGMLGPQDESNYRRSKILHRSSVRQSYSNKVAGVDVDKTKRELARPDGHVELLAGEFGRDFGIIPQTDLMEGEVLLLQEAKAEISMFGPNAALAGRGPQDQSGRAWEAQQQAGLAEIAILYAAANDLDLRIYRQMWMRARQFWTEQRFIRVTDNEQAYKFLMINEPVMEEVLDPMTGEMIQQPVIDPRTGQPAVKNRPAEMDVDIIIDTSPDYITSAQEEAQMLLSLAKEGMPIPPEMIIIASNMRNKRELLQYLENAKNQPAKPDPVEVEKVRQNDEKLKQNQQKLAQSGAKVFAEVRKTVADAQAQELENTVAAAVPASLIPRPGVTSRA